MNFFVLDDGWVVMFDDNRALGDWVVNEENWVESRFQLSKKGVCSLDFSLGSQNDFCDSDLYRQHPDWAIPGSWL